VQKEEDWKVMFGWGKIPQLQATYVAPTLTSVSHTRPATYSRANLGPGL